MSQCANNSYKKAGFVQEHHVYQATWIPELGEEFLVDCDSNNEHDEHTVAVMKVNENSLSLTYSNLHVAFLIVAISVGAISETITTGNSATPLAFIRIPYVYLVK